MSDKHKAHWEETYRSKTENEFSWFQPSPQISLRMIAKAEITADEGIIDVGGGASRLVDTLLDQGFHNLTVLDISHSALEITRKRLGKRQERVKWLECNVTDFALPQQVKLWHDRAVFHFLTSQDDRTAYLERLQQHLMVGGHLIISAFSPEGPSRCSGLDVMQYDNNSIQQMLGDSYKLLENDRELHLTPGGTQQHFNYFHFVRID